MKMVKLAVRERLIEANRYRERGREQRERDREGERAERYRGKQRVEKETEDGE